MILTTKYNHREAVKLPDKYGLSNVFKVKAEITHNAKLKQYPDGNNITIADKPIFKEEGWVKACEEPKTPKPKRMNGDVRADSVRRAKQTVMDIARLNDFRWFITWTLSPEEIDRYDPKAVSKKLKTFLMNKVKRNAAVYLIIPEHHKDGALHMHGLLSGKFIIEDSGRKTKRGQTIHNMPQWTLGFSTAIETDGNCGRISRYIIKYISKDFRKIFGSFYYAGGDGLVRKPPTLLYDLDYAKVNSQVYGNEYVCFKYENFDDDDETASFLAEHSPDLFNAEERNL